MNVQLIKEINTFGKRLRYFRKRELKMTQEKFAERIGLTYEKLGMLENGKNLPSYKTLLELEKEFNFHIDPILNETNKEIEQFEDDEDE